MNNNTTNPAAKTRSITILATLPYTFSDPRCCGTFKAEMWEGPTHDADEPNYLLTFTHADDCDIWRHIP